MRNNIVNLIQILKELNYVLNRKQKTNAIFVLIVIIISSIFELLGVTMILPFIEVLLKPDEVMNKPLVVKIMNILGITSSSDLLILVGVGMIFLYILKNIYMIWSYYIQYDYATRIQKQLSIKMLHSYMSRPYEFFLDINSAVILRGCNSDISGVYLILSNLMSVLTEVLSIIMIGSYLIYEDPVIALGVLGIMGIILCGIILFFKPIVKRIGNKNREVAVLKNKSIYQAANGIKEIFVMRRMQYFTKSYEEASEQARKVQRTYETISACPDRITEGVCVSGIIGIVCVRLVFSGADVSLFVPKLGAFAMAAFKIFPSVGKIANRMTGIIYQRPALSGVYSNMKEADEYANEQRNYIQNSNQTKNINQSLEFRDKLTIDHIGWKYKNQEKPVLLDACIEIKKGQSVAFIGPSGSGKTTLSDIILGLLHPKQGSVTMDNIDVYSIPDEWAHIVGYVPQAVFLIDDTVRNNVAFGFPKDQIKDCLIWDALEQAQLKDFVSSLPNGLDTVVGERGIKFSGGQKQRIAIARALFNKPEILVLDEATAALDNETESAVMESINALQGQITMIIVAHRLTTIRNCDVIYKIENGIAMKKNKKEVLED